ncbi:MAG: protein kinase, partial [Gemmatimonadetes bacterium]|nr:protein kinase [Gemmatimonadota bacterium]
APPQRHPQLVRGAEAAGADGRLAMIGTSLGPYKIIEQLGAGGMGEVYLAEDTRLGRKVAIKVLPPEFASDPERLARFEQEARAAAALNHPHIAAVFDVGFETAQGGSGEDDADPGVHFMVQEYLEGEPLSRPLRSGPLATKKALDLAIEIAEALAVAHSAGIVHRDLKPDNVFVTGDGHAKILDFGLAKLTEPSGSTGTDSTPPLSPTNLETSAGTVLGTAGYMAPEQVEGKTVDHRADLFSLGTLIYEMVTGSQPFAGRSSVETLQRIVHETPVAVTEIKSELPNQLEWVLEKLLAKDPVDRYQHADDLAVRLRLLRRQIALGLPSAPLEPPAAPTRASLWGRYLPWAIAAVAVVVTAVAVWRSLGASAGEGPEPVVSRFSIDLPPEEAFEPSDNPAPVMAISPDGRRMVYVAVNDGERQLYLRNLDTLQVAPIPGTQDAISPIFSPNGQWVAFFAEGKLKKVPLGGGAPRVLCDALEQRGATWTNDGRIIFAPSSNEGLYIVSDEGGTPVPLTTRASDNREISHRLPEVLPGDNAVIFTIKRSDTDSFDDAIVEAQSLTTGDRVTLFEGGSYVKYLPTGHLLYARAGTLLAVPFDAENLAVTGDPITVLDGVITYPYFGSAQFAVADNGTLLYVPGPTNAVERRLVWVDREGAAEPVTENSRWYQGVSISPDGEQIAVSVEAVNVQVWIHDVGRDILSRLTFDANNFRPIWAPDGDRLVFSSGRLGRRVLWIQAADPGQEAERLLEGDNNQYPNSWTRAGDVLAFSEFRQGTGWDILTLRMEEGQQPQEFAVGPFNESDAAFSPDGRWLAYSSNESGPREVYVQPYVGAGGRRQISADGGTEPLWSPSGDEIFYRNGARMMSVAFEDEEPSRPQILFERPYVQGDTLNYRTYGVAPDGRFLMIEDDNPVPLRRIVAAVNWFEELKRLVPTGGR